MSIIPFDFGVSPIKGDQSFSSSFDSSFEADEDGDIPLETGSYLGPFSTPFKTPYKNNNLDVSTGNVDYSTIFTPHKQLNWTPKSSKNSRKESKKLLIIRAIIEVASHILFALSAPECYFLSMALGFCKTKMVHAKASKICALWENNVSYKKTTLALIAIAMGTLYKLHPTSFLISGSILLGLRLGSFTRDHLSLKSLNK